MQSRGVRSGERLSPEKSTMTMGTQKLGPMSTTAVAILTILVGTANAQYFSRHIKGSDSNQLLGSAVAALPDVNGDGVPDYAVGSPGYNSNTGKVSVYSGATGKEIWSVTGDNLGDRFGSSLAADHSRFIVGAPAKTNLCSCSATTCDRNVGYVKIYNSSTLALVAKVNGIYTGGGMGTSVAVIGDISGDGVSDVVAGEPQAYLDTRNGATIGACSYWPKGNVSVINGSTGAVIQQLSGQKFGWRYGAVVGAVGDVNNDGVPDFASAGDGFEVSTLVSPTLIVSSGSSPTTALHTRTVMYNSGGWQRINPVGSLDGCNDFAYGDEVNDRVTVISGSCHSFADYGTISGTSGSGTGASVLGVPDVNSDGYPDIAVGVTVPSSSTSAGQVKLISGHSLSTTISTLSLPTTQYPRFGLSVGSLGDITGDGIPDFLIGAPAESNSFGSDGSAYVYYGPNGVSTPLTNSGFIGVFKTGTKKVPFVLN